MVPKQEDDDSVVIMEPEVVVVVEPVPDSVVLLVTSDVVVVTDPGPDVHTTFAAQSQFLISLFHKVPDGQVYSYGVPWPHW